MTDDVKRLVGSFVYEPSSESIAPSKEALAAATVIPEYSSGDILRIDIARALEAFAARAVQAERERLAQYFENTDEEWWYDQIADIIRRGI